MNIDKSGFLWNYDKKVPFSVKRVEIHVQKLTLSWFLSWFKFFGGFSTTSHKCKICTRHENLGRRVPKMLKFGKYANLPKRYHLMQIMANTVEESNFRGMVYLFSWISIKLSLKWVLDEPSRTKLTFSYKIGLNEKISVICYTFLTINQKLFDLKSSYWY